MTTNTPQRSRQPLKGAFLALMLFVLLCPAGVQASEVVDRIVAVVNGEMITLSELNKNLELLLNSRQSQQGAGAEDTDVQKLRRQVLDKMINDILLEQEAERYAIEVEPKEVQAYLDSFTKENNLTQAQLVQYLNEQGLTLEGYRDKIRSNIVRSRLLTAMVRRKVVVTDEEIKDYYEAHKGEFGQAPIASEGDQRLYLIVLDDAGAAKELRQRIVAGEVGFEEAARSKSVGPAASQGGDLGRVEIKDLVPEIKAVATTLPPGEVSEPFSLSGKAAIIKLVADKAPKSALAGEVPPLDAVRDQIRQKLEEPKMEELFSEYTKRLREEALIDVRL